MRSGAAALALLLACACAARAGEGAGFTAAPILQVPLGSRALGMGGAFTAVASDITSLYYNPAGLSRLNAHEAAFSFMSGVAQDQMQQLAYGGPLPFTGLSGSGYAGFGGSVLFAQSGTIEVNRTNADGSFAGSSSLSAGSDLVLTLGYGERVGTSPIELQGGKGYGINHFVGVAGKFVRSTLVERYSASAFTMDAGYLLNSPEAGLTFGLSVLNVGGQMRYVDEADPLPTTLRSGVAYQGGVPSVHAYTLATDGEYLAKEKRLGINLGMEYFWLRSYGARLGYQMLRDNMGLTMGFGYRWKARVLFDYAWTMGALTDAHRFTATYRFGGVAPSKRARQRRPFIDRAPEYQRTESVEDKTPTMMDAPKRPRPTPRRERPSGVPGWIY